MDSDSRGDLDGLTFSSPGAMLDHLRAHPEWRDRERDAFLGRLVEQFPAERIVDELRRRFDDLGGTEAEAVFRLIEAFPDPELLAGLAAAVERQPDLPPERAWETLSILEGAGLLERSPDLAERWEELNEVFEEDDPIGQLVEQIEDDADGLWLALQGLGAVEPEIRAQIVEGLADVPLGPGVVEFLRLLAYAQDGPTRAAAFAVLLSADADRTEVVAAWRDLAAHHPDPAVVEAARRRVGTPAVGAIAATGSGELARGVPRLYRSLVTSVDGLGRGTIVLSARIDGGVATAAFGCDLECGVRDVLGELAVDHFGADAAFDDLTSRVSSDVVENAHELALGLLAGSLTITGPGAPPALRFWVEATAGRAFRPLPFPARFPGWDPSEIPFAEMSDRASDVLAACPDWIDASPLTVEMAREIGLREGLSPPDPKRDAGAYRFLFEHGLRDQLERYRRMLLWMAWFWRASGRDERGRSALALALQLSDPQHVVPGHPFTVALSTRSLAAAQERLRPS
jgi:hypothetical protein